MAVISFSEGSSDAAWVVAGWAFRQILADVRQLHPDDHEMAGLFDRAAAVGYLRLGSLDKVWAFELAGAIKGASLGILAGTIRSGIEDRHDEQLRQEYLTGLRMLVEAARAAEGNSA
jgi:hypothetical protein